MIRRSTITGNGLMIKSMVLVSILLKGEFTMEAGLGINVREKEVLSFKMGVSLRAPSKIMNSLKDLSSTQMEMSTQDK